MYSNEVKKALLTLTENGFDTDYLVRNKDEEKQITSPEAAFKAVKQYANEDREHFILVSLDSKNRVINTTVLSVGTETSCLMTPRLVAQQAIKDNAYAVVVAHNHPSGDLTLSGEDITATKRMVIAGNIQDINVIDHIVFSFTGYKSIREEKSYLWDMWLEEARNMI